MAGTPGADLVPPLTRRDGAPNFPQVGARNAALMPPDALLTGTTTLWSCVWAPAGEVHLLRKRTSAFFATSLDVTLRRLGASRVVVCGLNTATSVRCSAFDAIACDYDVTVLRDAVCADKPFVQTSNLADIERAGCAVISTELYIASLVAKSLSPASIVTGAGEGLSQSLHLAGAGFVMAGEGITAAAGALTGGLQQLGGLFGLPSGAGGGADGQGSSPSPRGAAAAAGAGGAAERERRQQREREERERCEKEERERREREERERRRNKDANNGGAAGGQVRRRRVPSAAERFCADWRATAALARR